MDTLNAETEMPKYRCHKEVWALKIKKVEYQTNGALLHFCNRYSPAFVNIAFLNKHAPESGGYFVVYEDGYKSWSPAEAFEKGYTLIEND